MHVLARFEHLRGSPRAALFLWKALSLSVVLCLISAGPIAVMRPRPLPLLPGVPVTVLAVLGSLGVLIHLATHGHHVDARIRTARAAHRDLVDLVARHEDERTRVMPSDRLSAYCVPGAGNRLVITEAALTSLPSEQLAAIVAHEEAHLRERHDLTLEYFTVLHTAAPRRLRTDAALSEMALLVEVLADRAAADEVGEVALARAIAALSEAAVVETELPGFSSGAGAAATRIRLLVADDAPVVQAFALYASGIIALVLPPVLALLVVA